MFPSHFSAVIHTQTHSFFPLLHLLRFLHPCPHLLPIFLPPLHPPSWHLPLHIRLHLLKDIFLHVESASGTVGVRQKRRRTVISALRASSEVLACCRCVEWMWWMRGCGRQLIRLILGNAPPPCARTQLIEHLRQPPHDRRYQLKIPLNFSATMVASFPARAPKLCNAHNPTPARERRCPPCPPPQNPFPGPAHASKSFNVHNPTPARERRCPPSPEPLPLSGTRFRSRATRTDRHLRTNGTAYPTHPPQNSCPGPARASKSCKAHNPTPACERRCAPTPASPEPPPSICTITALTACT